MSSTTIVPVILCGGSGTRLWPRSRKERPKPFLPLLGERSLFQQTCDRFSADTGFRPPIVVAGEAHRILIEDQLGEYSDARITIEPAAKNTAPAIALAAHVLDPNDIMLVCPSDHYIASVEAFQDAAKAAAELASEGWLVSLGIMPDRPETGYGYLKRGAALGVGCRTEEFVEKPDLARAEAYLADGGYLWNAGIFAFSARSFLEELVKHRTEMAALVAQSANEADSDGRVIRPSEAPFAQIAAESVDYAVMEATDRAALVDADIGWSDIGNWQALAQARGDNADGNGNIAMASADLIDCKNVTVDSDGPRVSVVGLENVIVVVDGEEVLVTSAEGAQKVGQLPGSKSQ
ncbi:mannose-1-phosphate guanylyltransferase [Altererythrobacter sp. MF3-039]|uniref:mannose-1-phosphate guanylyltransferase n=1 Tax=Altererythrobacter sp. MF3-039 TaxID=3252901 RepID=UPI00390C8AF1